MQKLQSQRKTHSLLLPWQSAILHDWSCHVVKQLVNQRGCTITQRVGGLANRSWVPAHSFWGLFQQVSAHYSVPTITRRNCQRDTATQVTLFIVALLYISEDKVWTFNQMLGTEDNVSQKSQLLCLRGSKYDSADNCNHISHIPEVLWSPAIE